QVADRGTLPEFPRPAPPSTLFPYTTLFRSLRDAVALLELVRRLLRVLLSRGRRGQSQGDRGGDRGTSQLGGLHVRLLSSLSRSLKVTGSASSVSNGGAKPDEHDRAVESVAGRAPTFVAEAIEVGGA